MSLFHNIFKNIFLPQVLPQIHKECPFNTIPHGLNPMTLLHFQKNEIYGKCVVEPLLGERSDLQSSLFNSTMKCPSCRNDWQGILVLPYTCLHTTSS
jgi:hypothetical protein